MASNNSLPPSLKQVQPFIQRAAQHDANNPTIAYYCRVYALKQAIAIRDTSDPNAQRYIKDLLQATESQRVQLPHNLGQHHAEFKNFYNAMLGRCIDVYCSGNADKNLAMDFVHTGQLIEVSSYFEPLSETMQLTRKRCRGWAAAIVRDIREGRKPMAPPELMKKKQTNGQGQDDDDDDDLEAELDNDMPRGPIAHSRGGGGGPDGPSGHAQAAAPKHQPEVPRNVRGDTATQAIPPAPPVEEYGMSAPFAVPAPELGSYWDPTHDGPSAATLFPQVPENTNRGTMAHASSPPPYPTPDEADGRPRRSGNYVEPPPVVVAPLKPATLHAPPPEKPDAHPPKSAPKPIVAAAPAASTSPSVPATPAAPAAPAAPTDSAAVNQSSSKTPSYNDINLAQKKAKFAVSALDFSDIKTAIKELQDALDILKGS
jgi:vacuolar protein sorting-associated protein VTA1